MNTCKIIPLGLVSLGLLTLLGCTSTLPMPARELTQVSMEAPGSQCADLSEATEKSAAYLVAACEQSGRFVYKVNLNPEIQINERYNLLRHAGAMYALGMHIERTGDDTAREAIVRAGNFFQRSFVAPLPDEPGLLAAWSRPNQTGGDHKIKAKLGGAGLGLVALSYQARLVPGSVSIEELRGLARFIVFMQDDRGAFCSIYMPSKGGKDWGWSSLYYPGEAALGLIRLYELDPDSRWVQGAADALAYLARTRRDRDNVPPDHWALLATARLLPILDQCPDPPERELLIAHAVQVCNGILDARHHTDSGDPLFGSFMPDGRTTPTATRLEGLLAARVFIANDHPSLVVQIDEAATAGIDFLLRSQVTSGRYEGAFPRAIAPLAQSHALYTRRFNERGSEIRIDYVQHALSALMQWQDQICDRRTTLTLSPAYPE